MLDCWRMLATFLALALLTPAALAGQDTEDDKPAPQPKPSAPKEVVLKGTLTALEQEVVHALPLKGEQSYIITSDSPGFFIQVRIDDGAGKQLMTLSGNKTFKAPDDGMFRLLVSSPGGSSGQYVVSLRPINFKAVKAGEVLTVGPEGLAVEGALSKEDPLDKGHKKHCRVYDVKMIAGKTYVIDLMSKQFDAFLRLEDAAGKQLAQDDDSGGGNNARIRFKAPQEGVYRIIATTFNVETGQFLLKVREE
jgi:hypothetical protein